jgi:hypothetical protein
MNTFAYPTGSNPLSSARHNAAVLGRQHSDGSCDTLLPPRATSARPRLIRTALPSSGIDVGVVARVWW